MHIDLSIFHSLSCIKLYNGTIFKIQGKVSPQYYVIAPFASNLQNTNCEVDKRKKNSSERIKHNENNA